MSSRLCVPLLAAALSVAACQIRDDEPRTNQLAGLRVLALASEPADVVRGDTVTANALVYDEEGRDVSYQWSWCIARNSSEEEGYACAIGEDELQAAWAQLGEGEPLPPYDLGTAEVASLEVAFGPEQALAICDLLSQDEDDPERALFSCASRLGISFEVQVRAGDDQITAIKNVPLLFDDAERNQNPSIGPNLVRMHRDDGLLTEDQALALGASYDLIADVDPSASETFLPAPRDGLPEPAPRGESLFLSWFVTQGGTHRRGQQRTAFHDSGFIDSLIENSWDMPLEFVREDIRLYLVLRDERGGTSWREHRFRIAETAE